MRGLKLATGSEESEVNVASFTDAWIETDKILGQIHFDCVASFTDAWIETNSEKV